ncbi:MAG: histidinol dehydrogenase [Trueperaceae bacterium]|nr:MAG: histidinol dehydrogenase [Trueperaceae bacterium]
MQVLRGTDAALAAMHDRAPDAADPVRRAQVEAVIEAVRARGDDALREFSERFDGVRLDRFAVSAEALDAAAAALEPALRSAIDTSIARVRAFHERQPREAALVPGPDGWLGQMVRPLARVGCYVPAGQAPLFSSLIMSAVPAQVAGVADIVACAPPRRDGSVAPEILYVASVLGLRAVYRLGGAHAIAALAYGTEQVGRVDTIVGPGSPWVVIAKQLVFGQVGIESLPGPTETLVVADASADPRHVAADLLAQAEHDGAQPVLVVTHDDVWRAVESELERQLSDLSTASTARDSLEQRGMVAIVESVAQALEVANAYAPEHLCLLVEDPWSWVGAVEHAGGVFVGAHSMEALGDYVAGPSHVMPTGGTARYASALNVRHFQRLVPVVGLTPAALAAIGPAGALMARAEGLEAHARAIESRLAPRDEG